jgi:hypothetical protein
MLKNRQTKTDGLITKSVKAAYDDAIVVVKKTFRYSNIFSTTIYTARPYFGIYF